MKFPNPFSPIVKTEKLILQVNSLGFIGAIGVMFLDGLLNLLTVYIPAPVKTPTNIELAFIKILFEVVIALCIIFLMSKMFAFEDDTKCKSTKITFMDFIFCACIILGLRFFYIGTINHLTAYMPMPKFIQDSFNEVSINPIYFLLSVAILAPLKEEFLYRGLIFNGLCKKYPYGLAIILSSLLFAVAHLNLPQGINAFLIGIILSYIYYNTKSFYLCLFMHSFNNIFVSLVTLNIPSEFLFIGSATFTFLGLAFFIFGIKNLKDNFNF